MKIALLVSLLTSFIFQYGFSDENCTICQEVIEGDGWRKLECGHQFHRGCIKRWLKRKPLCPNCQFNVITGECGLDSAESEDSEPEVSELEDSEPEVSELEDSEPEVSEPEVSELEDSELESSELEVSEPEDIKPENLQSKRLIEYIIL